MKRITPILLVLITIFYFFTSSTHADTINVPTDYSTIQEGINAAQDGDIVLVQPGTYVENINYNGKNIIVASLFYTTQDTSYVSQTIIDGNSAGSVVTFQNGENSAAILNGFTLTNGYSGYGGGIYCSASSPTIEGVIIKENDATFQGGGLYCYSNSSPVLQYVMIKDNSTNIFGGGIFCSSSSPNLQHVEISGNSTGSHGAGIYCSVSSCPELDNVTITRNTAAYFGSGIYCSGNSSPTVTNSIIAENYGTYGFYVSAGSPIITYSDCWNNEGGNFYQCSAGTGCIEADPLFVDSASGDYHLSWINFPTQDTTKSPCIDSGDPGSPLDPDGTTTDMGAYYFNQDVSVDDQHEIQVFLLKNYPNPLRAETNIVSVSFSLKEKATVCIQLFNIKGQLIETLMNEEKTFGDHTMTFTLPDLPSGIYFTRLKIDGIDKKITKLVVMK